MNGLVKNQLKYKHPKEFYTAIKIKGKKMLTKMSIMFVKIVFKF